MNVDRYVEMISVSRWLAHHFPGAPEGDRHPKLVGSFRAYHHDTGNPRDVASDPVNAGRLRWRAFADFL